MGPSTADSPTVQPAGRDADLENYGIDPGKGRSIAGFEPPLVKRIVWLGVPVVLGMLTQTAINIIDTMMVGRLPDQVAVAGAAAIGTSLILLWAFGGSLSAISVGTQAMTARRFGEGEQKAAGKVLTNSLAMAVGLSVVVTTIAIILAAPIFEQVSHDPSVREVGINYSRIRFLGIFSMVATASFKSFYDGIGQVRLHMTAAILMNICNVVLNYVLIFGWDAGPIHIPAMQVEGAAWASVIASYVGLIAMYLFSLRGRDRKLFRPYALSNIDFGVVKGIGSLSLWSGLATVFVMSGFALFYVIVGYVDEAQSLPGINKAATAVIINIMMAVFMTSLAFGTSTATLVSQSLGAKNPGLATRYGWQSVRLIAIVMSLAGLALVFEPEFFLRLFLPEDAGGGNKAQVIAVATNSLRLCGALSPVVAAALVLTQALYGAGESRFVMIVEGALHAGALVPLAALFALYFELGLLGCWIATGIYAVLLLFATAWRFYSGKWAETRI